MLSARNDSISHEELAARVAIGYHFRSDELVENQSKTIKMRENFRVAFLGPLGTYSHEAAHKVFGSGAIYEEQPSISDVFAILSKNIPIGIVPHENSIFGAVTETYDLLRSTSSFVCGEITLKIEHGLLVKRGVRLHDIERIFSHEQALGQCRSFIAKNLPGAKIVKTSSTAVAAQLLLTEPPDCAAICSIVCAELYEGLEILFTGIQDVNVNCTTFYMLAFDKAWDVPLEIPRNVNRKALIRLSTPHDILPEQDIANYLKVLNLPAARISRRPSLDAIPFRDLYFVEAFDRNDSGISSWKAIVEEAIQRVRAADVQIFRVLKSFRKPTKMWQLLAFAVAIVKGFHLGKELDGRRIVDRVEVDQNSCRKPRNVRVPSQPPRLGS